MVLTRFDCNYRYTRDAFGSCYLASKDEDFANWNSEINNTTIPVEERQTKHVGNKIAYFSTRRMSGFGVLVVISRRVLYVFVFFARQGAALNSSTLMQTCITFIDTHLFYVDWMT